MRKKLVVVLAMLCVLAFCMAPAAAAPFEKEKRTNVIMSPLLDNIMWPKASNTGTVTTGEQRTYRYYVDPGATVFNAKVEWNNPSNNLGLMVTDPNGRTYGEIDDTYESPTPNGITTMRLQSSVLPSGYWNVRVTGITVTGSQAFTLNVVSS